MMMTFRFSLTVLAKETSTNMNPAFYTARGEGGGGEGRRGEGRKERGREGVEREGGREGVEREGGRKLTNYHNPCSNH